MVLLQVPCISDLGPAQTTATVTLVGKGGTYCVGAEMYTKVRFTLALQPDGISVKVLGIGYMYEGESCDTEDLATQEAWDPFVAAAGSKWTLTMSLYNPEAGSWDSSDIKLTLTNVTAP